jgi:hypothetical protein
VDIINAGTSQHVINSLPQTPTHFPTSLPDPINIVNEWLSSRSPSPTPIESTSSPINSDSVPSPTDSTNGTITLYDYRN